MLTHIGCPFHPRVTALARKKPSHSAKSAGGRSHLNTHTLLTQRSRIGLTMPLSRHSVETYPETSSHATCQGTFGQGRLSLLSHCRLILAYRVKLVCVSYSPLKKNKRRRQEMNHRTFSQNPCKQVKSHHYGVLPKG